MVEDRPGVHGLSCNFCPTQPSSTEVSSSRGDNVLHATAAATAVDDTAATVVDDMSCWITINNVHHHVAHESIIKAFLPQCIVVRRCPSQGSYFFVQFQSREDAVAAVHRYSFSITTFGRVWRFRHGIASRFARQEIDDLQWPPEARRIVQEQMGRFDDRMFLNVAIGASEATKVFITGVDTRVPEEVFEPIFATVGRVTSYNVLRDDRGRFQGRVEVNYERTQDAIAAVLRFHQNIEVFYSTWIISREPDEMEALLHRFTR